MNDLRPTDPMLAIFLVGWGLFIIGMGVLAVICRG